MEIKNIFLHHIDIQANTVKQIEINEDSDNVDDYVEQLVEDILDNPNRRFYNWKKGSTQVKNSLTHLYNSTDEVNEVVMQNAERLLEKEVKKQEQIKRLNVELQKGSLLHLAIESEGTHKTIICKVEHDEIISEIDFDLIQGLNTKKKLFKAILVYYNEDGEITHNYIHDKNSTQYWWDDFLELEQIKTDDENTENSLHAIDVALGRYKTNYKTDHLILRNSLIGYYRNNDNINYSDLLDTLLVNYQPHNPKFPKENLIKVLKTLPEKNGFETQFKVVKKKINKRKRSEVNLGNNMTLGLNGTQNIENLIMPIEQGGNKYLRIQTDEGYDYMKDLLKDDN